MKISRIFLAMALLAVTGASGAGACQYCWAAAAEGADLAQTSMRMHGTSTPPGAFPLDSTINQFQPSGAPADISTPPPADTIATSAADLKLAANRPAASPSPAANVPPTAVASTPPAVAQNASAPKNSAHWADAGLLSLAAVGGVFCWRTRRSPGAIR